MVFKSSWYGTDVVLRGRDLVSQCIIRWWAVPCFNFSRLDLLEHRTVLNCHKFMTTFGTNCWNFLQHIKWFIAIGFLGANLVVYWVSVRLCYNMLQCVQLCQIVLQYIIRWRSGWGFGGQMAKASERTASLAPRALSLQDLHLGARS